LDAIPACDGQTDGRTDTAQQQRPRYAERRAGENGVCACVCEMICSDGATIDVNLNKISDYRRVLDQLCGLWPQFDIDGVHNMWIVKPGDKSKGVGTYKQQYLSNCKYTQYPFTALTLLVGDKGIQPVKYRTSYPQRFFFERPSGNYANLE